MSDKTEAPSARRLADAREKGQIPRSMELNTAAVLLVGTLLLQGQGGGLVGAIRELLVNAISHPSVQDPNEAWLRDLFYTSAMRVLPSLGLFLISILVLGVAVTVAQTGFLWASKRVGFDFSRLNPLSGFKRIFSSQGLFEIGKNLLKLGLVGYVAYSYLNTNAAELMRLCQMDFSIAVQSWLSLAITLALRIGGSYLVLAIADYAYQRWNFMKKMRMTKEEVKEEYKHSEGNPFLKGRIRSQMRRMARTRMMTNVPKATVVITNPTHFAVAIEYNAHMDAPKVVAKGAHLIAQRIVAIARENNIPIVENVPVARGLYRNVQVDEKIPSDFFRAVAEILAYVYRTREQKTAARI
jgi:flagellar biosynthetic protein FlhB